MTRTARAIVIGVWAVTTFLWLQPGLVKPDGTSRKPDHDKVNVFLDAVNQYLLKWMYSPDQFRFPDELQHWLATSIINESGVRAFALPASKSVRAATGS